MKLHYLIALLLIGITAQAQIVDIPDANFKNALVSENVVDTDNNGLPDSDVDLNNDGEIQVSEAEAIINLDIHGFNIANIEGIQYFINLEVFKCYNNSLTSLDVAYSLDLLELVCSSNQLTLIEADNFQNLTSLRCHSNLLTELDVSQNLQLNQLRFNNNLLTEIDVSQNISLNEIDSSNNQITSLDLSQNVNLSFIYCENNQLTSLNIQNGYNEYISEMRARFNPNLVCIQVDDVDYANFQTDSSDCNELLAWCIDDWANFSENCYYDIVYIPDTNFKNAIIDEGVDTNNDGEIQNTEAEAVLNLDVFYKDISSLEGIQSFTNLEFLNCSENELQSIDVSQITNLKTLHCYSNLLLSLDVSQNPNLENLVCYNNQLTSLNVDQNLNLIALHFSANHVSSLNVNQNSALEALSCLGNQLYHLDLSQNHSLTYLSCEFNPLASLNIKNGNNTNMTKMWCFGSENLSCIQVDDENASYPICQFEDKFDLGWCKDDWTSYSENCSFGVEDFNVNAFKLHPNPVQNSLTITSEKSIDEIKIYSIQGIYIKEGFSNSMDVSELANGIYFAEISIDGNSIIKKFVKN